MSLSYDNHLMIKCLICCYLKYLNILAYSTRALGLSTIAAALSEDEGTIEDVIEPYLLSNGYIQRTAKGRILSDQTYKMFGKKPPVHIMSESEKGLFDQ